MLARRTPHPDRNHGVPVPIIIAELALARDSLDSRSAGVGAELLARTVAILAAVLLAAARLATAELLNAPR